jgi:hypothetical protein
MKYLVVDAMLSGTGIRDYYTGDYLEPESLSLSVATVQQLKDWLSRYKREHNQGYVSDEVIDELDREGKEIAFAIKSELADVKITYFSDARMTKELIS